MKVRLERTHGSQFHCVNEDGRSIVLSGSEAIGPSDDGVRPMQALLMALAGCSSMDVLLILQKGRHSVASLDVAIDATRADAVPAVFTQIHLHFVASGDFGLNKLERAVSLSLGKYCSVSKMLEPTVQITHSCALASAEES